MSVSQKGNLEAAIEGYFRIGDVNTRELVDAILAAVKEDSQSHQTDEVSQSNSSNLLNAKGRAKLFIDANVWDGEDRAGCDGDSARFTPDELQELIDDMLEHLSI